MSGNFMNINPFSQFITLMNLSVNPPEIISFRGIVPEELSEGHSANFESIDILGRSSPYAVYTGGAARDISISASFHEDSLDGNATRTANISEFMARLKSFVYPDYRNLRIIPPKCYLKIGTDILISGYCSSVDVTWKLPLRNGRYICADVSMSFTEVLDKAKGVRDFLPSR